MLFIVVAMLVILLLAGLVVVYAAYPGRGQRTPYAPWLGEAMEKAADALPTVESEEQRDWSLRR
ncbi:hypothetical protein P5P86_07595 [Nocardioides sp. BP30]|uniref:hypothetical protein n=1 Tax=Nocardioides sp. BP30 TaxID=3036374 RepID=UPI002468962B|nr:hypothetical protein [Nocardioides sp. BP30]WGL53684.1 hypothetical protein P5P86_07595 [Nocardioides sp. BP30]